MEYNFQTMVERQQVNAGQDQTKEKIRKVRRSTKKNQETYDKEPTVYTSEHPRFGEVRLRKDWGTVLDMDEVDVAKLVRDSISYIKKKGKLEALEKELDTLGDSIKKIIDKYPGLRGIESDKYNTSLTDIPVNNFSADKADVVKIREEAGAGFPQFGKELVIFSVTVPEEDIESDEQRQRIDTDKLIRDFRLLLVFEGLDEETQKTNVRTQRIISLTDRNRFIDLINEGLIPIEISGISRSRRLNPEPLKKTPEAENGENGNPTESN
jgi:hypothetical protein